MLAEPLNRSDLLSIVGVILSIVGIALSVLGLYLAKRSIADGRDLTAATRSVLRRARGIRRSLSTVYLGPFPEYIPAVTKLIESAADPLVIVTIAPAFGCFSAPPAWESLAAALTAAQSRGLPIDLVTGSFPRRRENYRLQFDDALADWQTWLDAGQTATSPSHRTRLPRFTTRYRLAAPPPDASTFLQELETVQHDSLRHVYFGATVIESDELLPVVAWIEGTRQAVFALSNPLGKPPAFFTRDKNVIEALLGLANRLRNPTAP